MKKLLSIAVLIAALFASCSDNFEPTGSKPAEAGVKELTMCLSGDFAYTISTRATAVSTPNDLFIFDYVEGEEVQSIHLMGVDDDKFNPKMKLSYGKHKLYIILSYGDRPSYSVYNNVMTWVTVKDTFWKEYELAIDANTASTISITLDRVIAKLEVKSLDKVPDDAESIRITPTCWYSSFNYLTGEACEGVSSNHNMYYTVKKGWDYADLVAYCFASKDFKSEINFEVSLSGGSKVKNIARNVPFKQNQITAMKGNLFTKDDSGTATTIGDHVFNIKVDDVWYDVNEVTW